MAWSTTNVISALINIVKLGKFRKISLKLLDSLYHEGVG